MLNKIEMDDIRDIALAAGGLIMETYGKDFNVEYKEDDSPLTQADTQSNELICSQLNRLYPEIPLMSEENKQTSYDVRKDWEYYFCIDPIDGTKEFIKKNGEFTVNIALIHKNRPVLGVVYAPALKEIYWAKQNEGAYKAMLNDEFLIINEDKLPIAQKKDIKNNITIVASKSHLSKETKELIDNLTLSIQNSTLVSKGSSLKLCMVATGEADIYPRLAPTMEWDTAAADAIVREAGKMSYQYENNQALEYNKENLLNPWFIVK